MQERWQMNKLGFVNFWLYDWEEFPFSDGRLLLRGENGAGKSVTTQSFIPLCWMAIFTRIGWMPSAAKTAI